MFRKFPETTLSFLSELEANNTKTWFDENRSRYHAFVLEPSRAFVEEMGEHLMALEPAINAVPKVNGSLFRIYRDQRFHSDEPPLKTHIAHIFWQGRGKRMQSSAFYMHFDKERMMIAAGLRRFKPPMLAAYRSYIAEERRRGKVQEILETLMKKGYKLPERRYRRFPKGFDASLPFAELSLYDAMYAYTEIDASLITNEGVIEALYKHYEALLPLQQWVYEMTLFSNE